MTAVRIGDNTGDTYSGCECTHIKENSPTTNYGTTSPVESTKYGTGDHTHTLVKFSGISSLPAATTINAAALMMYATSVQHYTGGDLTQTISARRVLLSWNESQTTWNVYTTGNNWGTAGCLSDGADRVASASSSVTGNNASDNVWKTFSGMAADVSGMYSGSYGNYGWHLERTDAADDTCFWLWSSDDGTDGVRPYLDMDITTGVAPAPPRIRQLFHRSYRPRPYAPGRGR